MKSDSHNVRICGDYKVTINKVAKLDGYPLPRIDDIFSRLSGGTVFSKLDLTSAYQQIELDEETRKYTTINTPKGLFQYTRLPFGISSAPAIFQRIMENLLVNVPNISVYLDDILVTGKDFQDHLHTLDRVLHLLEAAGLTLKKEKCLFAQPKVEYLGHVIDEKGLHPSPQKVKAVHDAPVPKSITELKSFIGFVNYYNKFISNLSSMLSPLYRLLQKGSTWNWSTPQQKAFDKTKQFLQSSTVLTHFDPSKPLTVSADASPYGIGGVLSHIMDDGSERPIAYTSRSLSPTEQRYSQLEKEGLAIVFSVRKFHQFLHGRPFAINSDHQPLKFLFDTDRPTPVLASGRIQRWALLLANYQYSIQYRPGSKMGNADGLSRLPLPEAPSKVPSSGDHVFLIQHLNQSLITADQIRVWTDKDQVLTRIRQFVLYGWPVSCEEAALLPYFHRKTELSVLWGSRVIILENARQTILDQLHDTHPGVSKMKSLARSFVWWPGLDKQIENCVQQCCTCQESRHVPAKAPIHPWEWPHKPWSRIHIAHAGPFLGHLYLILIDAHSKWIEVHIVSSTSSDVTIKKLAEIFSVHGIPEQIVSDNGTAFTSQEFKSFVEAQGIVHTLTSPYHLASNGCAERAVQTFKNGITKLEGTIQSRINRFLFIYRIRPQATTGVSPAELLMGRRLRCKLSLVHPDLSKRVTDQQAKMNANSKTRSLRTFQEGERVYAKNFYGPGKWIPAVVSGKIGWMSYRLTLTDGRVIRRHIDHLRPRHTADKEECPDQDGLEDWPVPPPPRVTAESQQNASVDVSSGPGQSVSLPVLSGPRRSSRVRKPVDRFIPN